MSAAGGGDPRTARTRARLREALLDECAGRPLAEVSVSAVVRRAGVGRATFYLHYEDLTGLAVDACADVVHEAVDALHAWQTGAGAVAPARAPGALAEFLAATARHGDLHRALLFPGGSGPLGDRLHEELRARALAERERAGAPHSELIASAVAGAFTAVLADWLHGLVPSAPEQLADHIWRLLLSLHRSAG
ncbi:TetR/AcrR family transcriptional regulator [Streptomyces sp. NPDC002073]|uniref:TetR/AcrR family transcriptional regulator n=1 Tax=Streptomyces sp. NBC_00239 TaxID=2903640 RepID=UPI002E2A68AA|nr:TetR/AcrR family transcriptional regulator [Streptomyces sp. NBC_00239]